MTDTPDKCDEGRLCTLDPGCPIYDFCAAHEECADGTCECSDPPAPYAACCGDDYCSGLCG